VRELTIMRASLEPVALRVAIASPSRDWLARAEQAIVAAQTQQATLVHMNAQQQRWNMEDQAMQKMRADADQGVNATGGANALSTGGGGGTGPAPSMAMPTFNAMSMR